MNGGGAVAVSVWIDVAGSNYFDSGGFRQEVDSCARSAQNVEAAAVGLMTLYLPNEK